MSDLYQAILKACLKSAKALGPDIKKLSWFGKNHIAPPPKDNGHE
jgi:hypothetical protein